MNPSLIFALFLVVGVNNGISTGLVSLLIVIWGYFTKGKDALYILLALGLISYLSIVHNIELASNQTTCAKVITHYEIGGILEIDNQRYRTFDSISPHVSKICATFLIKKSVSYQRISLDPLTRALKSQRIVGTIKLSDISFERTSYFIPLKTKIKDVIFPDRQDDLFWMIHHSGLWISSFLSIISSFLHLFFKHKRVNPILHGIVCVFAWLSWDPRTSRLLMLSCARLLNIPHQKVQGWVFVLLLLIFPYSVISLSFLFPFVLYVVKSCRINKFNQWIIMIALQQFVFASWSFILILAYSSIGQLLWWAQLVHRFFPQLDILSRLSNFLNNVHHYSRINGGLSGSVFFTILGLIALTQQFKFWKRLSMVLILILMIQPIRWLPQVHFINVGQGHATLLQHRNESILIDTGKRSQSGYLKHFLASKHVKLLQALLITHDDEDHSGGVEVLIEEKIIQSTYPHKTSWNSKSMNITSLLDVRYEDKNEDSGIYLIQLPNLTMLITGDAYHQQELQLINMYHNLKVDVYLAGHHGSKTSTHPDFLAHIDPKIVIISAQSTMYGHPHKETLRALFKQQVMSYQLEQVGDISIYSLPWFNLVLSSGGGFAIMR
jgi:competence protein ComEC